MTVIDTGTYGAKRQTFEKASPRGILIELRRRHPKANKDSLLQMLTDRVIDDVDMLKPIITYWFAGNFPSMERPTPKTPAQRETAKAERAAAVSSVAARIRERATRMVLLDMVMPSGKPLRDSTGKDCAKAGGWLSKIAKTIKPNDVVGKTLSEAQVRKLFGR